MVSKPAICITTYQREALLATLLSSLSTQSVKPYQVIITDNAANSSVTTVVERFADSLAITLCHEQQQGVVHARNKCLESFLVTDADALVWIDDDEWPQHDDWLANLLKTQVQTHADIVCSDVLSTPEDPSKQFLVHALYPKPMAQSQGEEVRFFYTNNTLLTRRVIEQVGMFDLRFNQTGSEDYDYCLRTKQLGFKIAYAQDAKVIELHPESRSHLGWFALRGIRLGQGATRVMLKQHGLLKSILLTPIYSGYRFLDACRLALKALCCADKGLGFAATLRFCSSFGTVLGLFGMKYAEYKPSEKTSLSE
ncbi:hypothetical protein PULV_a1092 [Pseudoalteromonas ulvae UL12]|uniref:glycosyltransferase family 2 protein n=1 Tax=Pseudoalteromonas ulvae TaxID=107327 RepID=UPI00186B6A3B|nr:glycosyltransferase [Pseudoalteromonas ulvae]MBE0363622.1 hypothetical protein [Pseudoalteromonas ulvae UL12]